MKQVHWQLPFASLDGNHYRIDIYAEGTPVGGIKQLTGAATPFTTDEDNSDDFFAPVRSQTGCINIIDEDGTLMESGIMPSDNVDKPVRLIRVSDSKVMWQGCISCEAYSQAYTSRSHELSIPINSTLEAMKSAFISVDEVTPRQDIKSVLSKYLQKLGISVETSCSISSEYGEPIDEVVHIMTSSLFTIEYEQDASGVMTEVAQSISGYDLISNMCSLLGMVAREYGNTIYFTKYSVEQLSDMPMSGLKYMDINHQISVGLPAHKIEITSSVKPIDDIISIPETPYYPELTVIDATVPYSDWMAFMEQPKSDIYPHIRMNMWSAMMSPTTFAPVNIQRFDPLPLHNVMAYTSNSYAKMALNIGYGTMVAGASYIRNLQDDVREFTTNSGIYAMFLTIPNGSGIPVDPYPYPMLIINSRKPIYAKDGYLTLNIDTETNGVRKSIGKEWFRRNIEGGVIILRAILKVGDKYYQEDGGWATTRSLFQIRLTSRNDTILIPLSQGGVSGEVEFQLLPFLEHQGFNPSADDAQMICEMYFKQLSIGYRKAKWYDSSESENKYVKHIDTKSKDAISVNLNLCTDKTNQWSENIILDASGSPIQTIDGMRPEDELLSRMSDYYDSPRKRIELRVARPDGAIPLVRIAGYDSKTYLPLSESRDWKAGVSTIMCFEVPE